MADVTDEKAAKALVSGRGGGGGSTSSSTPWAPSPAGRSLGSGLGELEKMLGANLPPPAGLLGRGAPDDRAERGSIVHVVSRAAVEHAAGQALLGLQGRGARAHRLSAATRGTGVCANAILLSIDTEQNRKAMPKADFSKWPKPEDIVSVIGFLSAATRPA
jgi:hypothetical protein